MELSLSSSVTRGRRDFLPCPWRLKIPSPHFLSCSSSGTDTFITVLIETKMSNRSHINRFVSFYGCGLLSDSGLRKQAGAGSARTVILKRDRSQRWNVVKQDRLGFDVHIFKSFQACVPFLWISALTQTVMFLQAQFSVFGLPTFTKFLFSFM